MEAERAQQFGAEEDWIGGLSVAGLSVAVELGVSLLLGFFLGFLALVPTVGCAGAAQQHLPP